MPGSPAAASAAARRGDALALAFLACRQWHSAAARGLGHCSPARLLRAPGSSTARPLTGPGLPVGSRGCAWSLAGTIPMATHADLTVSLLSAQ